MALVSSILDFFHQILLITSWRDLLEIALLATLLYAFIRWLAEDQQKNLLGWFYGYSALLMTTYYLNLAALHTTMFIMTPIAMMIFFMLHQQTLQKNFITLMSISSKSTNLTHWLEELMQGCLYALNKNREIICIIQRHDALDQFITAGSIFNAEINRELLELLIDKIDHRGPLMLWTTQTGKLYAINPIWRAHVDEIWVTPEIKALHKWKQDAIFITEKSDAITFSLSPTTRLCTLIIEGKMVPDLSAHHAFALLKNYCSPQINKGDHHATTSSQHTGNKPTRPEN